MISPTGTAVIRISSSTNPKSAAGAISSFLRGDKDTPSQRVEVNACGAGATNQAIKALAIARGYVAQNGKDLVVRPGFTNKDIDGNEKTIIVLFVDLV